MVAVSSPFTTTTIGFLSRDPIWYKGSKWNLYRYVSGRVLIAADPFGTDLVLTSPTPGGLPSEGGGFPYFPVPEPLPGTTIPPEFWPTIPIPPRTVDQAAAYAACAGISGASCGGCTQATCQQAVAAFIQAVDDSWLIGIPGLGPLGTDTCERQGNDILDRIPGIEGNPCVEDAILNIEHADAFGGLTTSHAWARMTLCNGAQINGDNGAYGGGDQIWVGNPENNQY